MSGRTLVNVHVVVTNGDVKGVLVILVTLADVSTMGQQFTYDL